MSEPNCEAQYTINVTVVKKGDVYCAYCDKEILTVHKGRKGWICWKSQTPDWQFPAQGAITWPNVPPADVFDCCGNDSKTAWVYDYNPRSGKYCYWVQLLNSKNGHKTQCKDPTIENQGCRMEEP